MIARAALLAAAAVALACGPDDPGLDEIDPPVTPEPHAAFASCTEWPGAPLTETRWLAS